MATRVLMLSPEYPPVIVGGIATHTQHLVSALAAAGDCEVTLVTARGLRDVPAVQRDGAVTILRPLVDLRKVTTMTARLLRENVAWTKTAFDACRDRTFDLIHCQGWLPGLAALQLAALTGLPLVTTFHSTERAVQQFAWTPQAIDPESSPPAWEDELLRVSTQVIAVSSALAAEVRDLHRYQRAIVVHNGIVAADGAAPARPPRAVQRFLFAGRITPHKGLEWMLDGLAAASDLPFELDIVGRDWEVPGFQAHLAERAERLGIGARVHFVGFLEPAALEDRYRAADAVIVPSLYEPFGLVCLEAIRLGVPLVASRTGGIVEFVDDSTAALVEPGHAEELAAAVRRLVADPAGAAARAARARDEVVPRFAWSRIAAETLEVYRRARSS